MTMGGDYGVAKDHLANLKRLNGFCLAFEPKSASSLDPMTHFSNETKAISRSVTGLIAHHSSCPKVQSLFTDLGVLNLYNEVLLGSIKLIFAVETPLFRQEPNLEFAVCIVKLYSALLNFQKALGGSSNQLSSMIHSFEYQFRQAYTAADNNVLRLDNIHDLSSHTFDLVAPPIVNLDQIVRRDFFRLSMNKFSMQRQLVEIFQFSNGEIAIFKVISGELPSAKNSPGKLLARLSNGDYSPLNVGRALLFPFLREYELEVLADSTSGVELKTVTGNNVQLKLHCVDALQWERHWKFCIKKLFDKSSTMHLTPRSCSSVSLAKSSHLFQNFKMKHQKLEDLRTSESMGLSIKLPEQPVPGDHSNKQYEPPKPSQSGLRRSKPLQRPLSTLMCMDEEEERRMAGNFQGNLNDCKHPSFEDLDSLDCERLMELDQGIQMELSPVSLNSPTMQQYKSVSQQSSMDKIGPISEKSIEVDDLMSVTSSLDNVELRQGESPIFNPSAEFYKPTLYRHKSSSLLSLFSSKNKKGLVVDAAGANAAAPSTRSSSNLNTPSSAKSSLPVYATEKTHVGLPSTIDLHNDLTIFESEKVRTSLWDGHQWMKFGSESSNLGVLRATNDATVLVVYENKDEAQCFFAARISPQWKCSRAAAQDIQAIIPPSDFLCSVLPPGNTTLNIRCSRGDGLLNTLKHCIKGNLPAFIPSSQTAQTVSSAPSLSASNGITRSSTGISDFTGSKSRDPIDSFLLMPSVKAKIHERIDQKGWQVQQIGHVDIFSQEYKGSSVAVKFHIFSGGESKENAQTFISRLSDIKRIGRTGLLIGTENDERLLEFVNKVIADQVYKLIRPW